ncbi:hypothetical protein OIU78_005606 [Salix suchowensis]|nr:hypothetical protein OIU78_005606 [Salix suchowensis]
MSMEKKPTQITESVIAKLMGLDELLAQHPVQKKQRVLSENYFRRVSSIGVREKNSEPNSCRLSSEEQKDHIEVFQISETLKRHKHRSMSVEKRKICSRSPGAKVMFRREEFKQSTGVSEDMKLRSSKECHDAQEVIDSKADDFPKYLQEPEFTKKVNNLQGLITFIKPLCPSDRRDIGRSRKFWSLGEQGHARKIEDGLGTYSCRKLGLDIANEFLGSQLDLNDGSCRPTTRIVVLKPKPGKAQNAGRYFSSTGAIEVFHSDDRNHEEILNVKNENMYAEVKERKKMDCDSGPARSRSRFSKQISRRMGHGINSISTEVQASEIRGSGTFPKDSELMIPSFPVFSERKNQFHYSDKPYLAREAKKHLSERWKTTKKFQQVELGSRCKTLGEMLAIPDCEATPKKMACNPENYDQVVPDNEGANSNTPLGTRGLEVQDGGHVFPKSRSLPVNFNTIASPKTMTRHKSLRKSSCMISPSIPHLVSENNRSADAVYALQNELENKIEVSNSHGQCSSFLGSSGQKYQTLQDPCVTQLGHKNEGSVGDLSEQNSEDCKSSMSNISSINVAVNSLADAEVAVPKRSLSCHELLELEPDNCVSPVKDEYSSRDPPTSAIQDISKRISEIESVSSHCSGTDGDPESLMSMEDAYQPSPDSVLEPLFKKEISSTSDCFESVSASLHGLRSHLELVKLEASEKYSEGSGMMVSSDEDAGEGGSVDDSDENDKARVFRAEESRNFSYLVDIMSEAGFDNRNLRTGFDSWHSQEYPISPFVFETLEKKFGEQKSWKRFERRLLFDRINSGLIDILQPSMGVPTWTKPVARRFSFSLGQEMIDELLWTSLVAEEKKASKESGKVLGKDDKWLELSDDAQIIGIEIEKFLMDELVADVVSMESF